MRHTRKIVPMPRSKFLEVECRKCKEHHIIFSKSASKVECTCGEELAMPTGGHVRIRGSVKGVLR
jgi:small subunit ribosomal protein S27e